MPTVFGRTRNIDRLCYGGVIMVEHRLSNLIGFDDAPFRRNSRKRVTVVGAIFANLRFDGVLIGSVKRDGDDATDQLINLLARSRFFDHVQAILLQGITFGGFNVVDIARLYEELNRPVLVVARYMPDFETIQNVLRQQIPGGLQKLARLERAGPMEAVEGVFVQRAGLSRIQAESLIRHFAVHGRIPEPLRVAHLIAGAIARGASRGRV